MCIWSCHLPVLNEIEEMCSLKNKQVCMGGKLDTSSSAKRSILLESASHDFHLMTGSLWVRLHNRNSTSGICCVLSKGAVLELCGDVAWVVKPRGKPNEYPTANIIGGVAYKSTLLHRECVIDVCAKWCDVQSTSNRCSVAGESAPLHYKVDLRRECICGVVCGFAQDEQPKTSTACKEHISIERIEPRLIAVRFHRIGDSCRVTFKHTVHHMDGSSCAGKGIPVTKA